MSFMVQAFVLLVSGVYYSVEVLPAWLQVFSVHLAGDLHPRRHPRRHHRRREHHRALAASSLALVVFGVVLDPRRHRSSSPSAERWAKKTGRLKRQG